MSQSKKYIIEVMADKNSLQNFKNQLEKATTFEDGVEIPHLSRESKAQIKKDLSTMFGVAEHQAEALQQMMQAVADGFASNKNVNSMKKELKDTLTFITTIMDNMSKMGESTDWMKQGVSFVDDFIKMKESIPTIEGLERSVNKLNKSFSVFKDALAETNAEAYLKRFGNSTVSEAESLAKAQKELNKIAKNRSYSLQKAIEKGQGEYDYTGWSKEKIEKEYKEIIQTIEVSNKEIENLRKKYKGNTEGLYVDKDYQKHITTLSTATHKLKNLPSTFGDGIDANLKMSLKEATDSVQSASNEIKNILDDLQKKGIELEITLPDADSEKFVSQINDFVAKATKRFKTKPISVFAEIKNPFKETVTDDGTQSNDIVDRFTVSLEAVKKAVNDGYKELTTVVNNDNSTLKNALTLKFDYKKSANDEVITDALAEMQKTIYESSPLNIAFETENVAESLAENIQKALKGIELPTFNVPTFSTDHFSADQFSGGAIPVKIVDFVPMEHTQERSQKQPPAPKVPPAPKQQQPTPQKSTNDGSNKPSKNIGELRITSALNKLLQGLKDAMETQQNIIKNETANIKGHNNNLEAHASDIKAARKRNELINKRLVEPNARKDKIQAEQNIIANRLQEAKDAYAQKYKELFAGDEYKKIRGLDEGLVILQENLQNTQQEYVDKLKAINQRIEETHGKMDKASSEEEKLALSVILKAQETEKSNIDDEYTEKLSNIEASIAKNRKSYAVELDKNVNAKQIDAELQPLRTAISDVATQLQAKKEELDAVVKEIQKIKVEVRSEHLNEQLKEPTERKDKIQKERDDLITKHNEARSVYDEKYKELLATKDGAIIGELDRTYESLQSDYARIKTEYEGKLQKINENIDNIQKRKGESAVVDRQIPELIKAQEEKRAEIDAEYTAKLNKIKEDITTNRKNHANTLSGDESASNIYSELQALKNSASELSDKLATKQKELDNVLKEIKAIKDGFEAGEALLVDKNLKSQIAASEKKVRKASTESGKIQQRTRMIQDILNKGENPSKYVLETTNEFWKATQRSINTAERSMMKRATNDAMKNNLQELFAKQKELESLDQQSNAYKDTKADIDKLWLQISEAAKALTGQDAQTFKNATSMFKNAYNARSGMSLLGLNDMSTLVKEEALKIVDELLSQHNVTSESIANLGTSYKLSDLSDYVGIAKTAMGVEDKTFAQYNKDIQAENTLIQIARNMELLRRLYQTFPKDNELPSESTIQKFIQYFGGFKEMSDVVEAAAKYLSEIQNINNLKEEIPLLKTLDDSGILEEQLPKIFKTIYGHIGDDDKQKISTVMSGYGLKDADLTNLDGDALVDAFMKMTKAFANNAFKDLDIQSPVFKQIEKLLSYNSSVVEAQKDLQDAVNYRRNYLQSATYTTQGRTGGSARTKTNNVYDVLQSNEPLNVRVVNDKNNYVASIYSPKGAPGEADKKYKANPTGFSNFAYEAGIKDEMNAIVAASLRETLLNNVSSMLASWTDGYQPTKSEIFQLASALPEDFKTGDYIDEDGMVIEVEELRKYVKAQKDNMVSASQLMRELVESGRIEIALGKNSITPNYAKKSTNYNESDVGIQLDKEKQLEKELKKLRNKDYSSLDKVTRARITGDYSDLDDITKARITGDYSALSASDQKKAKELGAILPIDVNALIADKQAELDKLSELRINTEKEIDAIIAIEDDLQARKAKRDKLLREKKTEESTASFLERKGVSAYEYQAQTNIERAKYKNKQSSVDELLSNIEFAKSYGIGDVSKLEETANAYRQAIAKKDALEESGGTEEELATAVKDVDAAEKALIEQYFSNNEWRVIKYLQQQFAGAKTKRDASMGKLQGELDAANNAVQKTENEINKLHAENIASINEAQMSLSSKYLESPKFDIEQQNREYEKAVVDKRKEIEERRKKLDAEADADVDIAKLKAEAIAAMDTDEYKALRSEWQKALTSNTPEAKQKRKELKEKLDAYEQEYKNAKNKWITTKSNQLDAELSEFISSITEQTYALAKTNHEAEITAKQTEIAEKKKALKKDVNNPEKAKEVAELKKKWKDLEKKAKTAEETNDRDMAIKLDNQAQDAKERYEVAKRSWIASQTANLDKELIDYIKQLELNDRTVANFNANLPDGAKVASSIEDVRAYIRETHEHLLSAENERFKQELDAAKNGTYSIDVEGRKKEIEKAEEEAKQDAIKSVTQNGVIMTDTQFMAQQHRDSAAAKAQKAAEEQKEIDRLNQERQVIRERAQVEDEAIAARRELIREERSTNPVENPHTTPTQPTSGQTTSTMSSGTAMMTLGGQGFAINTTSLITDLASANLASESTLRGIYEVLNGGAPKGGWDGSHGEISQPKGKTSGQPVGSPVADIKQQDADQLFALSVSKIMKQLSGRTTREAMAFIGAEGHIGKLIEGTKDGVPGDKIANALATEIKKVFAMIHNHPSKISGLSDIDLNSAVKYAYGDKQVKVHGTVANGLLTSVNFDGIDETTANAILGEYNKSLMKLAKEQTNLFGINKDGRFAIKNLGNDPKLQKDASDALYNALKGAFKLFGYENAVQQVGIDNLGAWKDSVIPKAQQQVEPVVESAQSKIKAPDVTQVISALNNIKILSDADSLDLGKLIMTTGMISKHPILTDPDNFVYAERHVAPLAKIVDNLNNSISSKDFEMVSKEDANIIRQLRDYLASFGKQKEATPKQEEQPKEQPKDNKPAEKPVKQQSVEHQETKQYEHNYEKGLGGLAQESTLKDVSGTLQNILGALNNGIKVTKSEDGSKSGDKKSGKKKQDEKPLNITAGDAWATAQEYIKSKYPNFTSLSSLKPVSGGYSIDVFRPNDVEAYAAAQKRVNDLIEAGKQETEEFKQAQIELNKLKYEQEKITLRIGALNGEVQVTQEKSGFQNLAIGVKAASKELQAFEGILAQIHDAGALTIGDDGNPNSANKVVANYLQSVKMLEGYKNGLSPDMLFDPTVNQQLSKYTLDVQNYRKEVMSLLKATSQLNIGKKIETDKLAGGIDGLSNDAIKNLMLDIVSDGGKLETMFRELIPVTDEFGDVIGYQLAYTVRNGKHEIQEMTAVLNPLTNELRVQKGAVKEVATGWQQFFTGLKGKAASIMQYLISITSIHDVFRYFSQGVQYVREIDSALTELKKVTDETDASYANFLQDISKTGSVIGATVSNLTTMAAEWARLGYSLEEAGALAESTAILLNVSEFEDATTASEALISTMQAFGYVAEDSQRVVDVLNEVGNNYAISSDGIATALQDSASALMEAGNNLEQSVALVAAANKVVQDPNSVGSALRTISLRLRGTSVKVLEEMGEETDGVVESVSKMQSKIEALTGVNILTDSGAYKETYTILQEIGQVWEDMSDIDQAALLELMAGKNRANTLAAILGNMEDLEHAYKDALGAEGSALKENAAYLDSIQGRIDLFNNSLQTMWMNLLNTDVIKGIVDIGTGLIKFLDSTAGRITALGVALGILDKFLKIGPAFSVVNNQFQILGKTTETIRNNFTQLSAESTGLFSKISSGFKSIFGPSDVGIDLSGLLSEDDFNAKINTLINGFNNLDKSVTNITWDDYVNGLSNVDDATKAALKTCTEQNGVVAAGTGAYQTYTGAATSAAVGTSAVGGAAQTTTAKLIGMKIAALAANAALTMGLSIIISLAANVVMSWINAGEAAKEAANNAVDASQKLREQNDSLAEYKEQINELRTALDSNTLSESDAYDAREKLLTIQNELIDKFGLERDGINLVTGAIQDQIAAIDELSKHNAQQWLNTNQKEINTAVEFFDGLTTGGFLDSLGTATTITNWGVTQNVADMMREYANDPANSHIEIGAYIKNIGQDINFTGSVEDVKSQVEDFQDWLGTKENELQRELTDLTSIPASEQTDDVKTRIESLKKDIEQLQDVREDIGTEYINWFGADSTYAANKAVLEEAQYNTALTQYTDQYTKILQAENDLIEAQAKGDKEGIKTALNTLNAETAAAAATAQANGQSYMVNFFNGIKEGYAIMSSELNLEEDLLGNILFADTGKGVKDVITGALSELEGMNAKEILQLGEIEPDNAAFVTLTHVAEAYGMTIEELCNALVKFKYIQSGFTDDVAAEVVPVQTYSELSASLENYNEIISQTSEIVSDNIEVTQEYKDSLLALGISSTELSECFDENNGLVVKNADLLNKLVKSAKNNIAQNTKLAKTQARLKYYELYKKMRQLTNGRKVENAATLAQVNALYKEMSALEKTIAKYSMLEHKLLGATNAYDKLAEAQAMDEATDYGSKAEELVNVLAEAFNTAELGTEAAQVAIAGLIPDEIIDKTKTLDEQMQQIYSYFTKGTMSQLFTIEFDDDGGITSVEMTKKNIEAFTESLIGSAESGAVFQGTWDEFTLNPAITSLEEFADACGLTEEVAFAFLTSLEKYDISWLGGDNTTLLDQLMGNDFEYQAYKNIEALADLEHQMANGKITAEEYAKKYAELSAVQDANNQKIRENATAWASASTEVNTAKQRVEELTNEINSMRESGASESEIQVKTTQLTYASKVLSEALKKKYALQEPTEMTLQITLDDIQAQIDQWKADNAQLVIDVVPKLIQDENGKWTIPADVSATLKEDEKEKIQEYLDLVNDQYTITVLADANPNDSTTELEEVKTAAEAAQKAIEDIPNPEINTTAAQTEINNLTGTVQNLINTLGSIPEEVSTTVHQTTVVTTTTSGTNKANGTAHAYGTANKSGSWGAPKTETSLVGELGPELLVRGNRWTTVGENGAEFTQVKKGDIIFNHRQTEDLLSKGYVTGRGKLQGGHAFASGTAYAGINTWDDAYDKVHNDYYNGSYDGNDDDDDDDAEDVVDFIEMKLEKIEAIIEKTSNKIANFLDDTTSIISKDELYDELIKAEKDKSEAYLAAAQKYNVQAAAALSGVPRQYQEMARNGAIAIEDFIGEDQVEIAEKIQEYRDWAAKADEAENGHLEAIAAISAHRVEQLEDIATDFENIISITESHSDLLQAEMDLIEETGNRLSESYYEELKNNAQKQLDDMQAERVALQKILDDSVAAGDVVVGSDDWYSMLETIYEVDKEIVDCKTSLEEFQNAINELYWDNFDKFIDQIDAVESELSNLYDLISDDDKIVDEMGNWTDEGYTALGLLVQQMENAQFKSEQYGDAIAKLKKDYANGLYSVDEYNEKLADLTDSQYDAIKSYESAKDAIVDLNKTRAEAVKKYMQDEIDAYSELIEKKKESLNSDKDAYDFQKQIQESDENIKDIERKIAALEGNTSTSAMAQKKRLEAELAKAKEEQQDMYYDHSIEKQQEALDKELENYTKNKEEQMDALDEYLKKEEQVIADSFDLVAENTKVIANTLIQISEEYGVTISDTVATPWINGTNAIGTYEEQLNTSVSNTTKNLETLKKQLENLQAQADKTAESIVNATRSTIVETNDGHQTSIKGYAKGSKSVEYDQWALIDELGDELQLVPNGAGRLDYIKKGTGILNNTLTERLMDLAMDPTSMIENNRPTIGIPGIDTTNNTITIDASVGTLLHVEHLDGSNPTEVAKIVDKAWEKKMQTLNNSIKKFTR